MADRDSSETALDPAEQLVAECRSGNPEAFDRLVRRYEDRVLNTALRYLGDYHQALDASQDIFLKVFRNLDGFKGRSAFETWLYRISANHCLNLLRTRRRQGRWERLACASARESGELPSEEAPDLRAKLPDELMVEGEFRQTVASAISRLPWKHRQLIVLRHWENLPYQLMAERLGISKSAVVARLHRARRALKKILERRLRA